jgi:hypothetical protein
MCRNIKTLHNFAPPATDEEIRASALQFVRKLSGSTHPSRANELAFERAVDKVAAVARELIDSLVTNAPPRNREVEAERARQRSLERFGQRA